MKELNTDKAITLMTFDGEYPITGITGGDDKIIYLNKEDYVNFLGVYNKIGFSDGEEIFFKDTYGSASFTAALPPFCCTTARSQTIKSEWKSTEIRSTK